MPLRNLSSSDLLRLETNRERWLAETERITAWSQYKAFLSGGSKQCIGLKITGNKVKESANVPDNAYVADLYEYCVIFWAITHRQIGETPGCAGAAK